MPFAKQQLAGLSEGQQKAIASALQGVGIICTFSATRSRSYWSEASDNLGTAQQRVAAAGIDQLVFNHSWILLQKSYCKNSTRHCRQRCTTTTAKHKQCRGSRCIWWIKTSSITRTDKNS